MHSQFNRVGIGWFRGSLRRRTKYIFIQESMVTNHALLPYMGIQGARHPEPQRCKNSLSLQIQTRSSTDIWMMNCPAFFLDSLSLRASAKTFSGSLAALTDLIYRQCHSWVTRLGFVTRKIMAWTSTVVVYIAMTSTWIQWLCLRESSVFGEEEEGEEYFEGRDGQGGFL